MNTASAPTPATPVILPLIVERDDGMWSIGQRIMRLVHSRASCSRRQSPPRSRGARGRRCHHDHKSKGGPRIADGADGKPVRFAREDPSRLVR